MTELRNCPRCKATYSVFHKHTRELCDRVIAALPLLERTPDGMVGTLEEDGTVHFAPADPWSPSLPPTEPDDRSGK